MKRITFSILVLVLFLALPTVCLSSEEIITLKNINAETSGYFCKFVITVKNNTNKEFTSLMFAVAHVGSTDEMLGFDIRETAGLYPNEERIITLICTIPKKTEESVVILHSVCEKGVGWYEVEDGK